MNYKTLIIIIVLMVLSIIGTCLWTGIAMREVTVVDHPYEDGLKYDATQKRYADLGWKVVVPPSLNQDGQLKVSMYDRNGAAMDGAAVEFVLNRIGSPEIRKYKAAQVERGKYG